MATEPKKFPEGEESAGWGGYTTRHQYEKTREKRKRTWLNGLFGALCFVLLFLSVFGVIGLVRGDFFPKSTTEGDGGETVRVPTGSQLNGTAKDPEKMIRELEVSLVCVEAEREDGTLVYGSGFVISDDGYLITSASLMKEGNRKNVKVYIDGISYNATQAAIQENLGFALLRVESMYGLIPVSTGNFSFVERGETLFAVGASKADDFPGTALSGIVASVEASVLVNVGENEIKVPLAYLDIAPNPSLYGAPVVDNTGSVLGFCTDAITSPYGNLAVVVPVHTLYTLVNQMLGN